MTRKVVVSKHIHKPHPEQAGRSVLVKEEIGEAIFHQFGVNYEEFESGAGNFSTAIIEWPMTGAVENVPVENIRFKNN